jgi:hypothetical protein
VLHALDLPDGGQLRIGYGAQYAVAGLTFEPALNVDGAQISSVSATAGLYTVTTASNHNLVAGDWVLLYYSTPAQTQESRVQVLASGLTSTQFQSGGAGLAEVSSAGDVDGG